MEPKQIQTSSIPAVFWSYISKKLSHIRYGKLTITIHNSRIQSVDISDKLQVVADGQSLVEKE